MNWSLDILFAREVEQFVTVSAVERMQALGAMVRTKRGSDLGPSLRTGSAGLDSNARPRLRGSEEATAGHVTVRGGDPERQRPRTHKFPAALRHGAYRPKSVARASMRSHEHASLRAPDASEAPRSFTDNAILPTFHDAAASASRRLGTGLGLYTVYSIVDQLQGGIDVESTLGSGTRFTLFFPRLPAVVIEPGPKIPIPPRTEEVNSARILVVEDESLIRSTIRQLLKRMGYAVITAGDAAGAIAASREFPGRIELLLSDMVLPDASGAEVAKTLAQERPGLGVLFMSAYPSDLLVQQGRILPRTRTLVKPFDETTLEREVRAALEGIGTLKTGAAAIL